MAAAEYKSDLKLTNDTPYLTLTGELWGVCCDDLYLKGTALYKLEYFVNDIQSWTHLPPVMPHDWVS